MFSQSNLIRLRIPFVIKQLPWLCRLYRIAFDYSSLSQPTLLSGYKTPLRYLTKVLFQLGRYFNYSNGTFSTENHGNEKICHFSVTNTQFHSLYFRRFNPCYEPEVCACLEILMKTMKCFYDVGANWGYFSGYVGVHPYFEGKIYAFEPQPNVFNDLEKFIRQAELSAIVSTHQLGLSDKKTKEYFLCQMVFTQAWQPLKLTQIQGTFILKHLTIYH